MPTARISQEKTRQILAARAAEPNLSARALAARFNIHHTTVQEILKRQGVATSASSSTLVDSDETAGDTRTISLPQTRIQTEEELVAAFQIDLQKWEIDRFIANKWEVAAKVGEGDKAEVVVTPLFQVKAFLKRRRNISDAVAEIAALKDHAKKNAKPAAVTKKHLRTSGNMLEINIPDAHFGKLAWAAETGHQNYDTKIAAATFRKALDALLERAAGHKFDLILFVVGNDLLNSDDIEGRTTAGTYVSTDCRYHKTFSAVRNLMIESVERLRRLAPVKVVCVSGNHDQLTLWHLGDSLECYFSKYKDVFIDNSPRQRKYHHFGKVMLLLTHGHKGKRDDYPLLMATEEPEIFGATKFREAHTGHMHTTQLIEKHGVRVRILPALCPPDSWHAENGFVGNLRTAEGYIWNKDQGLVGIVLHNQVD